MADCSFKPKRLALLVDELQSWGRYTFTHEDIMRDGWRSDIAVEAAVRRLKQQGRVASPRRGFFIIVPAEYRETGCPPASWFIDDLMRFLGQPYYVALLSAAAIHGAAHQQPMAFQVVTDRPTRIARMGRVRIECHMSRQAEDTPMIDMHTETGLMHVSTPEATAYDLLRYPAAVGYLDNIATVLTELAEQLDPATLVKLGEKQAVPTVQRLGYLLDFIDQPTLAEPLARALEHRRRRPILLAPGEGDNDQPPANRWRVIPNVVVEADL